MAHKWILEVLSDLAEYLEKNQLPLTLEQTKKLIRVSTDEILEYSGGTSRAYDGSDSTMPSTPFALSCAEKIGR